MLKQVNALPVNIHTLTWKSHVTFRDKHSGYDVLMLRLDRTHTSGNVLIHGHQERKLVTKMTTICWVIHLSGFRTRYQAPMEWLACFILIFFFPFWAFYTFISESTVERWGRKRWRMTCNKRSPDGLKGMLRFLVSVLTHKPQGFPASLTLSMICFNSTFVWQLWSCLWTLLPTHLCRSCRSWKTANLECLHSSGTDFHKILEPGGRDLFPFNRKSISEVG